MTPAETQYALKLFEFGMHFVFWCSISSNVLALIERWLKKWFPESKLVRPLEAFADLLNEFGALNFRDRIRTTTKEQ